MFNSIKSGLFSRTASDLTPPQKQLLEQIMGAPFQTSITKFKNSFSARKIDGLGDMDTRGDEFGITLMKLVKSKLRDGSLKMLLEPLKEDGLLSDFPDNEFLPTIHKSKVYKSWGSFISALEDSDTLNMNYDTSNVDFIDAIRDFREDLKKGGPLKKELVHEDEAAAISDKELLEKFGITEKISKEPLIGEESILSAVAKFLGVKILFGNKVLHDSKDAPGVVVHEKSKGGKDLDTPNNRKYIEEFLNVCSKLNPKNEALIKNLAGKGPIKGYVDYLMNKFKAHTPSELDPRYYFFLGLKRGTNFARMTFDDFMRSTNFIKGKVYDESKDRLVELTSERLKEIGDGLEVSEDFKKKDMNRNSKGPLPDYSIIHNELKDLPASEGTKILSSFFKKVKEEKESAGIKLTNDFKDYLDNGDLATVAEHTIRYEKKPEALSRDRNVDPIATGLGEAYENKLRLRNVLAPFKDFNEKSLDPAGKKDGESYEDFVARSKKQYEDIGKGVKEELSRLRELVSRSLPSKSVLESSIEGLRDSYKNISFFGDAKDKDSKKKNKEIKDALLTIGSSGTVINDTVSSEEVYKETLSSLDTKIKGLTEGESGSLRALKDDLSDINEDLKQTKTALRILEASESGGDPKDFDDMITSFKVSSDKKTKSLQDKVSGLTPTYDKSYADMLTKYKSSKVFSKILSNIDKLGSTSEALMIYSVLSQDTPEGKNNLKKLLKNIEELNKAEVAYLSNKSTDNLSKFEVAKKKALLLDVQMSGSGLSTPTIRVEVSTTLKDIIENGSPSSRVKDIEEMLPDMSSNTFNEFRSGLEELNTLNKTLSTAKIKLEESKRTEEDIPTSIKNKDGIHKFLSRILMGAPYDRDKTDGTDRSKLESLISWKEGSIKSKEYSIKNLEDRIKELKDKRERLVLTRSLTKGFEKDPSLEAFTRKAKAFQDMLNKFSTVHTQSSVALNNIAALPRAKALTHDQYLDIKENVEKSKGTKNPKNMPTRGEFSIDSQYDFSALTNLESSISRLYNDFVRFAETSSDNSGAGGISKLEEKVILDPISKDPKKPSEGSKNDFDSIDDLSDYQKRFEQMIRRIELFDTREISSQLEKNISLLYDPSVVEDPAKTRAILSGCIKQLGVLRSSIKSIMPKNILEDLGKYLNDLHTLSFLKRKEKTASVSNMLKVVGELRLAASRIVDAAASTERGPGWFVKGDRWISVDGKGQKISVPNFFELTDRHVISFVKALMSKGYSFFKDPKQFTDADGKPDQNKIDEAFGKNFDDTVAEVVWEGKPNLEEHIKKTLGQAYIDQHKDLTDKVAKKRERIRKNEVELVDLKNKLLPKLNDFARFLNSPRKTIMSNLPSNLLERFQGEVGEGASRDDLQEFRNLIVNKDVRGIQELLSPKAKQSLVSINPDIWDDLKDAEFSPMDRPQKSQESKLILDELYSAFEKGNMPKDRIKKTNLISAIISKDVEGIKKLLTPDQLLYIDDNYPKLWVGLSNAKFSPVGSPQKDPLASSIIDRFTYVKDNVPKITDGAKDAKALVDFKKSLSDFEKDPSTENSEIIKKALPASKLVSDALRALSGDTAIPTASKDVFSGNGPKVYLLNVYRDHARTTNETKAKEDLSTALVDFKKALEDFKKDPSSKNRRIIEEALPDSALMDELAAEALTSLSGDDSISPVSREVFKQFDPKEYLLDIFRGKKQVLKKMVRKDKDGKDKIDKVLVDPVHVRAKARFKEVLKKKRSELTEALRDRDTNKAKNLINNMDADWDLDSILESFYPEGTSEKTLKSGEIYDLLVDTFKNDPENLERSKVDSEFMTKERTQENRDRKILKDEVLFKKYMGPLIKTLVSGDPVKGLSGAIDSGSLGKLKSVSDTFKTLEGVADSISSTLKSFTHSRVKEDDLDELYKLVVKYRAALTSQNTNMSPLVATLVSIKDTLSRGLVQGLVEHLKGIIPDGNRDIEKAMDRGFSLDSDGKLSSLRKLLSSTKGKLFSSDEEYRSTLLSVGSAEESISKFSILDTIAQDLKKHRGGLMSSSTPERSYLNVLELYSDKYSELSDILKEVSTYAKGIDGAAPIFDTLDSLVGSIVGALGASLNLESSSFKLKEDPSIILKGIPSIVKFVKEYDPKKKQDKNKDSDKDHEDEDEDDLDFGSLFNTKNACRSFEGSDYKFLRIFEQYLERNYDKNTESMRLAASDEGDDSNRDPIEDLSTSKKLTTPLYTVEDQKQLEYILSRNVRDIRKFDNLREEFLSKERGSDEKSRKRYSGIISRLNDGKKKSKEIAAILSYKFPIGDATYTLSEIPSAFDKLLDHFFNESAKRLNAIDGERKALLKDKIAIKEFNDHIDTETNEPKGVTQDVLDFYTRVYYRDLLFKLNSYWNTEGGRNLFDEKEKPAYNEIFNTVNAIVGTSVSPKVSKQIAIINKELDSPLNEQVMRSKGANDDEVTVIKNKKGLAAIEALIQRYEDMVGKPGNPEENGKNLSTLMDAISKYKLLTKRLKALESVENPNTYEEKKISILKKYLTGKDDSYLKDLEKDRDEALAKYYPRESRGFIQYLYQEAHRLKSLKELKDKIYETAYNLNNDSMIATAFNRISEKINDQKDIIKNDIELKSVQDKAKKDRAEAALSESEILKGLSTQLETELPDSSEPELSKDQTGDKGVKDTKDSVGSKKYISTLIERSSPKFKRALRSIAEQSLDHIGKSEEAIKADPSKYFNKVQGIWEDFLGGRTSTDEDSKVLEGLGEYLPVILRDLKSYKETIFEGSSTKTASDYEKSPHYDSKHLYSKAIQDKIASML